MRILWFKPILPFPPRQGTRRVTFQLLTHLAEEHEIQLFCRGLEPSDAAAAAELEHMIPGLQVHLAPAPNRRSTVHRAWHRAASRLAARRGVPPVEYYTAMPGLLDDFARIHHDTRPDLAVVEYWYAAPYLDRIAPAPRVLFAHDIEYRVRERAARFARESGRGGGLGALEVAREKRALATAPHVWFLTEGDREEALALGLDSGRTSLIPYGVEFPPLPESAAAAPPNRVLLFGSFLADFNRDALEFTLDEVWPAIRRLHPDAVLEVAGGGLPDGLRRRCAEAGVRVRGEVADVQALLLGASVVLIPLRYGGGLRIRLLEALALERAVVGTPVGVLGMGPRAEREVLVGETAEELAEQVARALSDSGLRSALGGAGREWVVAHHATDAARDGQKQVVRDTADALGETPRGGTARGTTVN